jgi:hypothetical protein
MSRAPPWQAKGDSLTIKKEIPADLAESGISWGDPVLGTRLVGRSARCTGLLLLYHPLRQLAMILAKTQRINH